MEPLRKVFKENRPPWWFVVITALVSWATGFEISADGRYSLYHEALGTDCVSTVLESN